MTKSNIPEWVQQELAKADEAIARGKLEQAAQPLAKAARYDARKKVVVIELANGASFAFPPHLAQGLEGASAADLADIEITPMGTGLHWPRLDADLTVDGLLAGVFGSRSWLRAHAARAGRARTAAKGAAARANGAKGGRPKKTTAVPV
jgi:hypothetical protein